MTPLRALAGTVLIALIAGAVALGAVVHAQNIQDGQRLRRDLYSSTSLGPS